MQPIELDGLHGLVDVAPIDAIRSELVLDEKTVLGRSSGECTGRHGKRSGIRQDALAPKQGL